MLVLTLSQVRVKYSCLQMKRRTRVMLPQIFLSQAEHDEMASAILVTVSMELAEKVSEQTELFYQSIITGRDYQKISR